MSTGIVEAEESIFLELGRALHRCCQERNLPELRGLLERGAPVDFLEPDLGGTLQKAQTNHQRTAPPVNEQYHLKCARLFLE